jgi:hypothetical protein
MAHPPPAQGERPRSRKLDADWLKACQLRKPRLLVCAPSNAAVDEVVDRITVLRGCCALHAGPDVMARAKMERSFLSTHLVPYKPAIIRCVLCNLSCAERAVLAEQHRQHRADTRSRQGTLAQPAFPAMPWPTPRAGDGVAGGPRAVCHAA